MLNIRKNKKQLSLIKLIAALAILTILAGTAADIGLTFINKTAQGKVKLRLYNFSRTGLLWKRNDNSYTVEYISAFLGNLITALSEDSERKYKISICETLNTTQTNGRTNINSQTAEQTVCGHGLCVGYALQDPPGYKSVCLTITLLVCRTRRHRVRGHGIRSDLVTWVGRVNIQMSIPDADGYSVLT